MQSEPSAEALAHVDKSFGTSWVMEQDAIDPDTRVWLAARFDEFAAHRHAALIEENGKLQAGVELHAKHANKLEAQMQAVESQWETEARTIADTFYRLFPTFTFVDPLQSVAIMEREIRRLRGEQQAPHDGGEGAGDVR